MRDEVLQGFRQFDENGILTEQLSAIINELPLSTLFSMEPSTPIIKRDTLICVACRPVVDVLIEYLRTHSKEELLNLLSTICTELVKYSEEVCTGVISLNLVSDSHSQINITIFLHNITQFCRMLMYHKVIKALVVHISY
jgi:hypothetical protein